MSGPRERGGASNRALAYAVAGSFLFHASLLFVFSLERQARREAAAPAPIVARLAAPQTQVAPPQVKPEVQPPKPRIEPAPPKPEPRPVAKPAPVPKPSPAPAPASKPTPAPQPPPSHPSPAAAPSESPPSVAPAPNLPAAVARTEPAPGVPSAPSADDGTLATYRMDLMRMARHYKRYPRVALDNNWEGRAVVRLVIGANGMTSSLTVVSSAGHQVLDKQALDMIQKAKPRVQIPSALRGREFSIEIPVIYDLKDQGAG
ncbi:MAG TPA: TonB family protein [Burkholderiales bacterium]|nr:TonB family protein [Burkholderiales bacterium]